MDKLMMIDLSFRQTNVFELLFIQISLGQYINGEFYVEHMKL